MRGEIDGWKHEDSKNSHGAGAGQINETPTTVKINDPTLRSGKGKGTRKIRLTVRFGQKWGSTKTFETRDLISALLVLLLTKTSF